MIKVDIVAEKIKSSYSIPFQIDEKIFSVKFDTGAAYYVETEDLMNYLDTLHNEVKNPGNAIESFIPTKSSKAHPS